MEDCTDRIETWGLDAGTHGILPPSLHKFERVRYSPTMGIVGMAMVWVARSWKTKAKMMRKRYIMD